MLRRGLYKTKSIKLGGVASCGEAAGTLDTNGEDAETFAAVLTRRQLSWL